MSTNKSSLQKTAPEMPTLEIQSDSGDFFFVDNDGQEIPKKNVVFTGFQVRSRDAALIVSRIRAGFDANRKDAAKRYEESEVQGAEPPELLHP
jgi:hypothetical protein